MANPKNKEELMAGMAESYSKLCEQIDKMTTAELEAPFTGAGDAKKCGARWIYDQCARDLLIHLHEWQVLMRVFVDNIRKGEQRDYLPTEYRKNYHEMDRMLVEKHQGTSLGEAKQLLSKTHEEMLQLASSFTQEELYGKGYYRCTYTTTLAAYFTSVTTSPYGQATKILKTHSKNMKK